MGEKGKLVSKISVKWEGDFFQLARFSPYRFSEITPHKIQSVDLVSGQWGTAGSVISWAFIIDGEKSVAKEVVEAIDEEKKSITFKVIEGELLQFYSAFKIIFDVETNGEDNLVTYTLEYEKQSSQVPDPTMFMDFFLDFSKDIERSQNLVPNSYENGKSRFHILSSTRQQKLS